MEQTNPELATCPDKNERCIKLARKVLAKFMDGKEQVVLDPVLGGLVWRFSPSEADHYEHVTDAVAQAGIAVERNDTVRRPGTDQVPRYRLRRVDDAL